MGKVQTVRKNVKSPTVSKKWAVYRVSVKLARDRKCQKMGNVQSEDRVPKMYKVKGERKAGR